MSNFFLQSISIGQKEVLNLLSSLDFGVLVGGTALALQIGHRKSYDLDFVLEDEISGSQIKEIHQLLKSYNTEQLLLNETQYTFLADGIKVTFFQDEGKYLHNPALMEGAKIASIQDIFSSKLYILGRRATWRDYCDIAFCLDNNLVKLESGIRESCLRYKIAERWILEPLTFFSDLNTMPIEWLSKSYSDQDVKNILVKQAKSYSEK